MSTPDFNQLMEKAKEMQEQMKNVQGKITAMKVTGEAGGGLVKIVFNGSHSAEKVTISPTLIGGDEDDLEILEELIAAAINDGASKIEARTKDEMMRMAKDLKLPE